MKKRIRRVPRYRPPSLLTGTLTTAGSPTLNAGGSCTIDETGADRVQCDQAQVMLDETIGWFATLLKPTWASSGVLPNASPWVFGWADAAFDNRIASYFDVNNRVTLARGGASQDLVSATQTWAANDPVLVVGAWTLNSIKASLKGDPFTSNGSVNIPTLAAANFDIGAQLGAFREIDSPMFWFACGRGSLTDADVTAMNALGTSDIQWSTLPPQAQMTMRWTCDSFTYEKPAAGAGTVTITSPTASQAVAGVIVLRGTTAMPATVSKVEASINGGAYRPASVRGNTWRLSWNTGTLAAGSHTFTVRATDVNNVVASSSVGVSTGSQTIIPGIGILAESTTYNAATNKDKFSVFDNGQTTVTSAAGTYPTLVLGWGHAANLYVNEADTAGVSWAECVANGWLLKDASNNNIQYPGDPSYLTDIGSASFAARFVDRWINNPNQVGPGTGLFSQSPGIDGLFIDNIIDHLYGATTPVLYPTHDSWRAATVSFVQRVGAAFQDAGYYFGCNLSGNAADLDNTYPSSNGTQYKWWMAQLAPWVNGFGQEYYMVSNYDGPVRDVTVDAAQNWNGWITITKAIQDLGCDHHAWCPIRGTNLVTRAADITYCKASFLLDWEPNSGSSFMIQPAGGEDVWSTAYTQDVGAALTAKSMPQANLWKRTFQKGATTNLVLVNANASGSLTQDGHTVAGRAAYIGVL